MVIFLETSFSALFLSCICLALTCLISLVVVSLVAMVVIVLLVCGSAEVLSATGYVFVARHD